MSEPKRLTDEELADAWDDVFYDDATRGHDCINAHISALDAELAAAHAVIAELVGPEAAGFTYDGAGDSCIYCKRTLRYPDKARNHDANCPIVRGRALLKGAGDE